MRESEREKVGKEKEKVRECGRKRGNNKREEK